MHILIKVFSATMLALLLSACASAPEIAPPDVVRKIKRVAVVSTVGSELTRTYIGATVFGNEKHVRQVPEWGLDRTYEGQISAELKQRGYVVVEAAYPAGEFAKVNQRGRAEADWEAIGPVVKSYCDANRLDGVFVMAKWGPEGIGVYAQRAPRNWFATLYLRSQIGLFDCGSARVVAARQVANPALKPKNMLAARPMPGKALPDGWPWYGQWEPQIYAQARPVFAELPVPLWGPLLADMLPPAP